MLLCPSLQQGNNGQLGDKWEKLLNLMPKCILGMMFDSKKPASSLFLPDLQSLLLPPSRRAEFVCYNLWYSPYLDLF